MTSLGGGPYGYGAVVAPQQRAVPPSLSAIQQQRFPASIGMNNVKDNYFISFDKFNILLFF